MPVAGGVAIFGDGSDGDHTVTASYSGGPITNNALTRDAFFNNLTIDSGAVLDVAGYRIFVKGTLTNPGAIHRNGNNGSQPAAGAALSPGSLGGSAAGGNGGSSVSGNTDGNPGSNGSNETTSLGDDGGDSGAGGNCEEDSTIRSDGGAGAIKGSVTAPTVDKGGFKAPPLAVVLKEIETTVNKINGGAGAPDAQDDALRKGRAEIANAEIAAGAAIVYSKLSLAASLLVSDIVATEFNVANKLVKLDGSALVGALRSPTSTFALTVV
ncbi:hypothetical protein ES703_100641 [subsurface metagenome]